MPILKVIMKIELEFKNQEEFIEFVKSFNNAVIAYNDIVCGMILGAQVSPKWEPLLDTYGEDGLRHRVKLLIKQYEALHEVEKSLN